MSDEKHSQDDIYSFAERTLVDNYLKLARVNVVTGEYEFLKKDDALNDPQYDNVTDIYEYIARQVQDGLISPDYARDYYRFSDREYVMGRLLTRGKRLIHSYMRKSPSGEIWMTFAIIAPHDFSEDNPYALFTWRDADPDTITMVDAVATLSVMYHKILKINLTNDTFFAVKVDDSEADAISNYTRISEWWKEFCDGGGVHEHDREAYKKFTDIEKLRQEFKADRTKKSCRYRRRAGDMYHWVQMDLTPSIEYTDEHQVLILYVKDIHDEYMRELNNLRELENTFSRDALTMLNNRHKFNTDTEAVDNGFITCLYIDLNGLHEVNNLLGHKKGDDMLCSVADALRRYFPDEILYRIGGDEFVMLTRRLKKPEVAELTEKMKADLEKDNYAISVGISDEPDIHKMITYAEQLMREDKGRYYERHGDRRKNREMNKELERILAEKHDAESFLQVISERYAGVYFVNLRSDTIRHIYIPDHFLEQLQQADLKYSGALSLYAKKYVKEDYLDLFNKVLNYNELEEALLQNGVVQFSYQKKDSSFMNLRIVKLDDSSADKDDTLWIFFYDKHHDAAEFDAPALTIG